MSPDFWIILTASLVGVSCGVIGCYLILRKMAMLADGISHSVLLGIVAAFLLTHTLEGIAMLIGAALVGLLTAFLVQILHQKGVQSDAAIGVVFTSLFSLGVVLISVFANEVHIDLNHVLYGEIAYIPFDPLMINGVELGPVALWMVGGVLLLNLILIFAFYKELKISSFDPALATALGIPTLFIHYLLMSMVSITTVSAFDSVGAILVVGMLIIPGATAYLLTDRLGSMLFLSACVGVLSTIFGYIVSYWMDSSIAGSMVMMAGVLFALALFFSPRHGLVTRRYRLRKRRVSAIEQQ